MELIHNSLKVFDKQMGFRLYTPGGDSVTIFDIMLYNEISQTLFMYDHYKNTTKASLFKNKKGGNINEELLDYENLNKWFTRTMTSVPEIQEALSKYDSEMRNGITEKILQHKK